MKAPTPKNEKSRLLELKKYDIMDTLPEQSYDDITKLAAYICDTPIALISLVDNHRQWFKSRVGLNAEETDKDAAFCAHAIIEPENVLIIPNALEDDRFADNPLVLGDPHIRFYAGAPLISEGFGLGTLCVIDQAPRELTDQQMEALCALSRAVMSQLDLRLKLMEINEMKKIALEKITKLREED